MYVSIVSYREHKCSELFGFGGMATFLTTAGKLPRSKENLKKGEKVLISSWIEKKGGGGGRVSN